MVNMYQQVRELTDGTVFSNSSYSSNGWGTWLWLPCCYFGDLVNNTSAQNGEVVFGGSSSGVKGFFGEVKMEVNNANNAKKELFAVSTGFVQSS